MSNGTNNAKSILAAGQMAIACGCSTGIFLAACESLGIGPEIKINRVDFFDESRLAEISARVEEIQIEARKHRNGS